MRYAKAETSQRLLAALIDGLIAGALTAVPVFGPLLGAAYLLTKDVLMYELTKDEQWKNRSVGKKLFSLQVVTLGDEPFDLTLSAKRNITLAAGTAISIIPVLGWVLGPVIGLILAIVELSLLFTDGDGRRYGDRWANTQVIAVVDEKQEVPPEQL